MAKKYRQLAMWLSERKLDQVKLTFEAIEGVLGFSLPDSAIRYHAFWFGDAMLNELHRAGWQPSPSIPQGGVIFRRRPDLIEQGQVSRRVTLRKERSGEDSRYLDAWLDEKGALRIDGQDLGPSTLVVSSDGEYEWSCTIRKADIPSLLRLLGEQPDASIIDVLEHSWSGKNSHQLEKLLHDSGIPLHTFVWSG